MAGIELRPTQLHWMEDGDPFRDCCVHGGIYFKIDDLVVCDGNESDWSVSTAAFNFLRTLSHDHPMVGRESLIPHCGFTMWLVDSEPDGLYMPNCDLGINWSIKHEGDQVVHEFIDGTRMVAALSEWSLAVCKFADEIDKFMHTAWPKMISDEEDRKGFELFLNLWEKRRAEAEPYHAGTSNN